MYANCVLYFVDDTVLQKYLCWILCWIMCWILCWILFESCL